MEARRQFDLDRGDKEARSRMSGPARDKLMYMLMQRLGMPSRELKKPGWADEGQLGGYDMNDFNQRMGAYQPGMGGAL